MAPGRNPVLSERRPFAAASRLRFLVGAPLILLAGRPAAMPEPASRPPVRVELFTMSHCPFSAEAALALLEWKELAGDTLELELHWIAREIGRPDEPAASAPLEPPLPVQPGRCLDEPLPVAAPPGERFASLHGPAEVEEDLRQLVLQSYFPDLFPAYLRGYYQAFPNADWRSVCTGLGVAPEAIEALLADPSTLDAFARDIEHARTLGIQASPTLLLDGEFFPSRISHWSLGRVFCRRGLAAPESCAKVPVCGNDLDCVREGFIGECVHPDSASAECVFHEPATTTVTVLEASGCPVCATGPVLNLLRGFLPLLNVRTLAIESSEGRDLIRRRGIRFAPAYLLPREIESSPRFAAFRVLFRNLGGTYAVDWEWMGRLLILDREAIPGRVDLIAGSLSPQAASVRTWFRRSLPAAALHERLYLPRNRELDEEVLALRGGEQEGWRLESVWVPAFASPRGATEIEENLFERSLLRVSPDSFPGYRACVDDRLLRSLDPAECRALVGAATAETIPDPAAARDRQRAESEWVESLGVATGSFALLVDNQILLRDFGEEVRSWLHEYCGNPD